MTSLNATMKNDDEARDDLNAVAVGVSRREFWAARIRRLHFKDSGCDFQAKKASVASSSQSHPSRRCANGGPVGGWGGAAVQNWPRADIRLPGRAGLPWLRLAWKTNAPFAAISGARLENRQFHHRSSFFTFWEEDVLLTSQTSFRQVIGEIVNVWRD